MDNNIGAALRVLSDSVGVFPGYVQQSESAASEGMIVCNKFCAYVCFLQELSSLLSVPRWVTGQFEMKKPKKECEHSSVNG